MGMRFVCPHPGRRITLRGQKIERLADGNVRETRPGMYAQFLPLEYNENERLVAYEHFGKQILKGSRMNDETMTERASQDWRIGTFDSGWIGDPDERKEVERLLLEHRRFGRDFIRVETVRAKAPWNTYDRLIVNGRRTIEHCVKEIVRIAEETGVDRNEIAAYERENLNRAEVLEALVMDPVEQEIVVAA